MIFSERMPVQGEYGHEGGSDRGGESYTILAGVWRGAWRGLQLAGASRGRDVETRGERAFRLAWI